MALVRASFMGRLWPQRPAVCSIWASQFSLHVASLPRRKPLHLVPSTVFLAAPSVLKAGTSRQYSVELDDIRYEQISDETLESLSEYLEELVALDTAPQDCDVLYSSGVLTVHLGTNGTYVINKQTPNKQIWLSSPTSGPKRFDFQGGVWVYRHSGETLHGLLTVELSKVFSSNVDFLACAFGSSESA
ncbi:frataxin, mitochondrial-like isoform X2 [Portunus trituberculatus]|nr:frataxin, mitochondrial-like isoform X2 [Portunus trituberculatus]